MAKYFGYCPECGFETFGTEKEAKEYADAAIDYFRNAADADQGWSEEVEQICWGEIKEAAVKCDEKTTAEAKAEGIYISSGCEGHCDYEIKVK